MNSIENILNQFSNFNILVIGDVMIDQYINGSVERISPEAPVPVVRMDSIENRLGGAGNVAMNLKALGANVEVCSVIGNDDAKDTLLDLFNKNDISTNGLIIDDRRTTTIKSRVVSNKQQILRIDNENSDDIDKNQENKLIDSFKNILKKNINAVVFEDYNKGVLTEYIIEEVTKICNKLKIPTAVDPKEKNFFAYKNVTVFKPNLKELQEGLNISSKEPLDEQFLEKNVQLLKSKLNQKITLVTLSENGLYICSDKESSLIPAHLRNISDVSGAGDTVISVALLCYLANTSIQMIGEISNIAGGMVCEIPGVARISNEELKLECLKLKI